MIVSQPLSQIRQAGQRFPTNENINQISVDKYIFVIGGPDTSHRSGQLIAGLLRFHRDHNWVFAIIPPKFLRFGEGVWKYLNLIPRFMICPIYIFFAIRSDILYVPAMNFSAHRTAKFLKAISRRPLVLDSYITATLTVAERGGERCWIGTRKQCESYDKTMFEIADYLIHPTRAELLRAAELLNISPDISKWKIVPLAIPDLGTSYRTPSTKLRICWWGNFTPLHGLDIVLDAISQVCMQNPHRVELKIFGTRKCEKWIPQMIKEKELQETVSFSSLYTFADGSLPNYLKANCDLALGSFGNSTKSKSVITNKLVEGLSMAIPVVTAKSDGCAEFIESDEAIFVDPTSTEIAKVLESLIEHPELLHEFGGRGRCRYEKTFTPEQYQANMAEIFSEAINGTH